MFEYHLNPIVWNIISMLAAEFIHEFVFTNLGQSQG